MNRFLSETGNKVQAHKGVFWLIEDKLLTFPFEKNRYQSSVSKSGDIILTLIWACASAEKILPAVPLVDFIPRPTIAISARSDSSSI